MSEATALPTEPHNHSTIQRICLPTSNKYSTIGRPESAVDSDVMASDTGGLRFKSGQDIINKFIVV